MNTLRRTATLCLGLCLGASLPLAAQAEQKQLALHGFFSQGYLYSKGNDFFGESTEGSWEYYEAGAGGRYRITPYLSLSGQFFARDAGRGDNGSVRTDYFYADLRLAQSSNAGTGLRFGRVRNPYGFYNSTRDVFFTRPSIILPQQYLEGFGVRELLFSSDGAQFHSYWEGDKHHLEFTSTFGKNDKISSDTVANMFGTSTNLNGDAELQNPIFAQLSGGLAGDRWKAALSYYNTTLAFNSASIIATLDATLMAASLQYNAEKVTVTGEYSLLSADATFVVPAFNLVNTGNSKSETAYIQADYRFDHGITAYSRFDHRLGDRERPNETDSSILTVGARWQPTREWQFAAELHGIRGTSPIPAIDNPNTTLAERSELLVLMAGYRF